MAKATPVEGLTAHTPTAEAAHRLLAARLEDVRHYEDKLLTTHDADDVHDMRVGTRRLRAALGLFARSQAKQAAADVRTLGRALGAVRELDVQVLWLVGVLERSDLSADERPGVERLREDRIAHLAEPELALREAVERWRVEAAQHAADFATLSPRGRLGGKRLLGRLDKRLRRLDRQRLVALSCIDPEPAHLLRITAKKLRYEAELLLPAQPACAHLLEVLQPLQSLLGDLHDTDVHQALVEERLADAPVEERPGLVWLLRDALVQRGRLAGELVTTLLRWPGDELGRALHAAAE